MKAVGRDGENGSYPASLSGGMAQRASLARAFAYPCETLLMDEPFSSLDVSLKKQMTKLFLTLYRSSPKTVVYVTHDPDEAVLLADKIIVMGRNAVLEEFICNTPRADRTLVSCAELKEIIYRLL